MRASLLARNRNFRMLFGAGAVANLGDGLVLLALPWLATLMTQNPVAIAAVAATSRVPWLLFSIPAGVIIDKADHRKLIARADLVRAVIAVSMLLLALTDYSEWSVWVLASLAFTLGSAEVLRDSASQTFLPTIVEPNDLEKGNAQLWSSEQLAGQFIGPPLAGLLIAAGVGIPFGVDVALFALSAGLIWMISVNPTAKAKSDFTRALFEGISFMRGDLLLLRLAIFLGFANFMATSTLTVQVLFAQDVLSLSSYFYGLVLSGAALGAIAGSLFGPWLISQLGKQMCLYLSIATWCAGYGIISIAQSGVTMGLALFFVMAGAMVWNVVTVSWRQRRVPIELLGRVNSIYRFFGWGTMPLGALAGGILVAYLENDFGREFALRATYMIAAIACLVLLVFAVFKLRLEE